jgi:hypothetical protein
MSHFCDDPFEPPLFEYGLNLPISNEAIEDPLQREQSFFSISNANSSTEIPLTASVLSQASSDTDSCGLLQLLLRLYWDDLHEPAQDNERIEPKVWPLLNDIHNDPQDSGRIESRLPALAPVLYRCKAFWAQDYHHSDLSPYGMIQSHSAQVLSSHE